VYNWNKIVALWRKVGNLETPVEPKKGVSLTTKIVGGVLAVGAIIAGSGYAYKNGYCAKSKEESDPHPDPHLDGRTDTLSEGLENDRRAGQMFQNRPDGYAGPHRHDPSDIAAHMYERDMVGGRHGRTRRDRRQDVDISSDSQTQPNKNKKAKKTGTTPAEEGKLNGCSSLWQKCKRCVQGIACIAVCGVLYRFWPASDSANAASILRSTETDLLANCKGNLKNKSTCDVIRKTCWKNVQIKDYDPRNDRRPTDLRNCYAAKENFEPHHQFEFF